MFSAHDSTGAVAADQLIHLIRRRKVEVKFDRVLQAGGTKAVTETAASVTDAQTAFTFTDSGITVEGSSDGYECNGTVLTIDAAGTYLLSGSCTDSSVKIKKGTTGVRLILSGLSLTSADTAPITCNKSSEVVIVAAEGTDGPTIAIAEACEGIEAAALSIRSSDISIVCTDDCLNAANSDLANYDFAINISGGNVTVWSGGNADNQPLDADGTIAITGGSAGMGMNLSTTQAYVTFGSAGISGTGNMGGQPGSFGGMQPPQNGGQPKSDSKVSGNFQPSDDFRPGDMTSNNSMSSGGSAPSDGFGASLISAGSIMTILAPSGSTVYSGEAACRAAFVFFSSADLNTDKTYTLSADSISAATATAQAGTSTAQNGGQPGQMPGSGSQPGQPGEGQQPGGDPPAMPGSDNSSGNAI